MSERSDVFLVQVAPTTSFSPQGYSLSYGPGKREGHAKAFGPDFNPMLHPREKLDLFRFLPKKSLARKA